MAARASLGIGLMVDDVFVAAHAGRSVGSNLSLMNVVTCGTVTVAFRLVGEAMEAR